MATSLPTEPTLNTGTGSSQAASRMERIHSTGSRPGTATLRSRGCPAPLVSPRSTGSSCRCIHSKFTRFPDSAGIWPSIPLTSNPTTRPSSSVPTSYHSPSGLKFSHVPPRSRTPPRWRHGRKLLLPVGPASTDVYRPATDPECAGVGVVLEAADWVSMAVACPDCCDAAAVLEGVSPARSLGADASSSPASSESQTCAKARCVVFKGTHIVSDSR